MHTKKEQIDQDQINKILNSIEGRQSQILFQTINEVNIRKSTLWAKLKTVTQEEQIQMGERTFQESAWNSS